METLTRDCAQIISTILTGMMISALIFGKIQCRNNLNVLLISNLPIASLEQSMLIVSSADHVIYAQYFTSIINLGYIVYFTLQFIVSRFFRRINEKTSQTAALTVLLRRFKPLLTVRVDVWLCRLHGLEFLLT